MPQKHLGRSGVRSIVSVADFRAASPAAGAAAALYASIAMVAPTPCAHSFS